MNIMLDIKFIRENPQIVKDACRKKQVEVDIDRLLEVDRKRRELLQAIEDMRAKKNRANEEIKATKDVKEKEVIILKMRELDSNSDRVDGDFKQADEEFKKLMLLVPNVPDESVPEGKSDKDNKEIKKWGKIPEFNFPIKDHIQLARDLDLIDFERGTKVAGFRGYFLKNEGALLNFALWRYALDFLTKKGFTPFQAPSLVKEASFMGTGWLPQAKDDIYATQEDLYLVGTSEVSMMGYHSDEILREEDLPSKYVAFSPCFRTEIGSYGKDTKGIYRVHEFMKVEQIILCQNDHEESVKWHEEITKNSEQLVQGLKLPYRVVANCAGDLGLGQVKKYDIETWIPSQKKYGETHSASYFHDFQTRRLNIRYRTKKGEIKFVHSLNNTAIATPRILIQILENYQQKDGSVKVPAVLQKYTGFRVIKRK